jgi:hypothetical protein
VTEQLKHFFFFLKKKKQIGWQAYDGHMNLILSDVEETIHIVEQTEGGQGIVNACTHLLLYSLAY